jgi:hypothetical protein
MPARGSAAAAVGPGAVGWCWTACAIREPAGFVTSAAGGWLKIARRTPGSPASATAFFASLDGRNRYAILYRVPEAKRPETRARRIDTFVTMLANGEQIHP